MLRPDRERGPRTGAKAGLSVLLAGAMLVLPACSSGGADPGDAQDSAGSGTSPSPSPSPTAEPAPAQSSDEARRDEGDDVKDSSLHLSVHGTEWTATLADNSSAEALRDLLADGPMTIDMRDYQSMEKVGPLGTDLPRNDRRITAQPGDLILYQGNALVIYYAPNTWSFTRLGTIDDVTPEELLDVLGSGSAQVTLSLG